MIQEVVIRIGQEGLLLVLIISAPPVVLSLLVGLLISLFQATTQIQEQTLTFVPKMIVVYTTLALVGSWMMATLVRFAHSIINNFPSLVG